MTRTILIADSRYTYRQFLKALLAQHYPDCEVFEASDTFSMISILQEHSNIELLLLDDELAGGSILQSVKRVRSQWPALVVMVMSEQPDKHDRLDILNSGMHGFIDKSTRTPVIIGAVSLVLAGEIYLPRDYVHQLLQLQQPAKESTFSAMSFITDHLTPRQCEVLRLLVEGHRNKEICIKLNMSMGTIKTHCNAIFRFLNVSNRTQAAQAARRMQLV